MTEPVSRRTLGDIQRLLAPFNQSFRESFQEIPKNVERSERNIKRIEEASRKGVEKAKDAVSASDKTIKQIQKKARRVRLLQMGRSAAYQSVLFRHRLVQFYFQVRLFWAKYRFFLLLVGGLALTTWLATTYLPAIGEQLSIWVETLKADIGLESDEGGS